MGCTNSSEKSRTDMENAVRQQTKQINNLEKTNKELQHMLSQILEETHRSKAQESVDAQVQQKVQELEAKIGRLETQLQRKKDPDDTFSRDSEPDILLGQRKEEEAGLTPSPPGQPEERPSASILEDPSIKEMYERRRALFKQKLNRPPESEPKQPGMA